MNILMLSDVPPSLFFSYHISGRIGYIRSLSEILASSGHNVIICTINPGSCPDIARHSNITTYYTRSLLHRSPFYKYPKRRHHLPIQDLLVTEKIQEIIKKERPEIIHGHDRMLYSFLPLKEKYKIPVVATIHDYSFICPTATLMWRNKICDKSFTRRCVVCKKNESSFVESVLMYGVTKLNSLRVLSSIDRIIAVSTFIKETYAHYVSKDKISVIPGFIDTSKLAPNRPSLKNVNLPKNFILYVGALIPKKGYNVLIEAFEQMKRDDIRLVSIGMNPEKLECSIIHKDNVVVIENAPRELLLESYSRCKFVVVPSLWPDPCPAVALEAMAFRKAVVGSNIGGLTEIVVNHETGLLKNPGDIDELKSALTFLIGNPQVAKVMGKKGYARFARNFTAEAVVPQILDTYNEIIETR